MGMPANNTEGYAAQLLHCDSLIKDVEVWWLP